MPYTPHGYSVIQCQAYCKPDWPGIIVATTKNKTKTKRC